MFPLPQTDLLPMQADATGLRFVPETGTWEEDQPDGSVLIHSKNPVRPKSRKESHDENLADVFIGAFIVGVTFVATFVILVALR